MSTDARTHKNGWNNPHAALTDTPARRLDETDLENLAQAAASRGFAHPTDVLRLVAEVRALQAELAAGAEEPAGPKKSTFLQVRNGRCTCDCGDVCPLGRLGMQTRCTAAELARRGIPYETERDSTI